VQIRIKKYLQFLLIPPHQAPNIHTQKLPTKPLQKPCPDCGSAKSSRAISESESGGQRHSDIIFQLVSKRVRETQEADFPKPPREGTNPGPSHYPGLSPLTP
jgi:hypothetical protein